MQKVDCLTHMLNFNSLPLQNLLNSMSQTYDDDDFEPEEEKPTPKQVTVKRKTVSKNQEGTTDNSLKQSYLPKVKTKTIEVQSIEFKNKDRHKKSNSINTRMSLVNIAKKSISQHYQIEQSNRSRNQTSGNQDYQIQQKSHQKKKNKERGSMNLANLSKAEGRYSNSKQLKPNAVSKDLMTIKNKKILFLNVKTKSQSQKIKEYFSHSKQQLQIMTNDQVNRLNNKVKDWIIRMSDELTVKINQAIRDKNISKDNNQNRNSPQKIIQLLQSHISNNDSIIELIQKQHRKLHGKQGQFKQQEYQILLDKEIDHMRDVIKETNKNMIKMKKHVNLDDDKIRHKDSNNGKVIKKIDFLKFDIMQSRKQTQKYQKKILIIHKKYNQLEIAVKEKQSIIQRLTHQAHQKNILLQQNTRIEEHNQLKKKIDKLKLMLLNSETSHHRHVAKLQTQIKNIGNQARQFDEDIKHVEDKIKSIKKQAQSLITTATGETNHYKLSNAITFFQDKETQETNVIPVLLKTSKQKSVKYQKIQLKQIRQTKQLQDTEINTKYQQLWQQEKPTEEGKGTNNYKVKEQQMEGLEEDQNEFMQLNGNNMNQFLDEERKSVIKQAEDQQHINSEITSQQTDHSLKNTVKKYTGQIKQAEFKQNTAQSKQEKQSKLEHNSNIQKQEEQPMIMPKRFQFRKGKQTDEKKQQKMII